ncbi:DUF1430 domain-containing protein [Lactococcus nasutitermitis]|uniref:DUF1430 domain-containing protein n=1 Tax=Lactococcus nasutitermitis TaxID=1652957 RepID=A0ABV9JDW3_9LACT|nr:DUF1430 domain-containing protein [Lactococcus nasutitermitis]
MNKAIKFVFLILFAVISFSAANMTKNDLADSQITRLYDVQGYTQIYLPSSIDTNKELVSLMKSVSEKTGTSFLFRSVYIGAKNDGRGNANLLKDKNNVIFFRSDYQSQNKKVLLSHGFSYDFWNEPLSKISSVQLSRSDIYVKNKKLNETLQELSNALNQKYAIKISAKKLKIHPNSLPPTSATDFISYNNSNLILFINISIIFFGIFLFIWLVENNKSIAIYRLNGMSTYKIGKQLFLGDFIIVSLVVYLLASLLIFKSFSLHYTVQIALLNLIVSFVSYVSIAIVSGFSLINQLNSKSFLRYSYYILYGVKVFVFLVTVSTTASLLYFVNSNTETNSKIGQEYGVLYPEYVGYNLNNNNIIPKSSVSLFDYAEKHEGLYVNLLSANNGGAFHVLQVNDNYLLKFPIISADNRKIKITTQEKSGIVLIDEKYKSKLSKIKKDYSFADSFSNSKVKYYFIKDNQKVQLLDGNNSKIIPDVLEVYTLKNAGKNTDFLYNTVLKFKIHKSKDKTYEKISQILNGMGELETQPSMVTVNNMNKANALSSVGNPWSYAVTNGLVVIIFLSMILATTVFYFENYKKKIAVKRLYGISFFSTYKSLFVLVISQGILYFAYALTQSDVAVTLEALMFYFIIEILIITLILIKLQKHLFLNVLKGE